MYVLSCRSLVQTLTYVNQRPEFRQHIFELSFQVDNLRASLSKADNDGVEKPLGDVSFGRFALAFVMAKFDMKVDVNLRYDSFAFNFTNYY